MVRLADKARTGIPLNEVFEKDLLQLMTNIPCLTVAKVEWHFPTRRSRISLNLQALDSKRGNFM